MLLVLLRWFWLDLRILYGLVSEFVLWRVRVLKKNTAQSENFIVHSSSENSSITKPEQYLESLGICDQKSHNVWQETPICIAITISQDMSS